MLTKNELKLIKSLQQKKYRKETGLFIVEGKKVLEEALKSDWEIEFIVGTEDELSDFRFSNKHNTSILSKPELDKLSQLSTSPDIIAVLKQKKYSVNEIIAETKHCFILDQITDPGNLGTILRIAHWFDINVLLTSDCVDPFNLKVAMSSMGSIFHTKWASKEFNEILTGIKSTNKDFFIADLNGKDLKEVSFKNPCFMVLGNESNGPREWQIEHQNITIPSFSDAESLNVAISSGIIAAKMKLVI